ncbi:MAG: hypothetical protein V1492_01430 [Candidatus Micrarchaeota archaeon]
MKITILVLLILVASVAFADVGPAPEKPEITVTFLKGEKSYISEISLVYHCLAPNEAASPVGDRNATFSCSKGVCKNSQWYYKFNPCFYPEDGYFIYTVGGVENRVNGSGRFNATGEYNVIVNMDNNEITSTTHVNCGPSLVLLAAIGVFAFLRK